MSDLRIPPAKADTKFWDAEARKLMLISYKTFMEYATHSYATNRDRMRMNGAVGLAHLGFRHCWADPKTGKPTGFPKGPACPITAAFGRGLLNACKRVYQDVTLAP